jgi:6-phosphogluconolactonase
MGNLNSQIDSFYLTKAEYFSVVADYIIKEAKYSINNFGLFKLLLSGGNTPIGIFKELVNKQNKMDWGRVELYWVDERCVPISSLDSNYGNCKKYLINNLVDKPKSYPMYKSKPIGESINEYQRLLKKKITTSSCNFFDLALLGIGADGHVASIFPNTEGVNEKGVWVVPSVAPAPPAERMSLTFPIINSTKKNIILAKGAEKKWVFDAYISEKNDQIIPALQIRPVSGDLVWFVSF